MALCKLWVHHCFNVISLHGGQSSVAVVVRAQCYTGSSGQSTVGTYVSHVGLVRILDLSYRDSQ